MILLPMALIVLQGDTGSALVFASFILVFTEKAFSLLLVLGISILPFLYLPYLWSLIFSVAMIVLWGVVFAFTYTNKKILLPSILMCLTIIIV